MSRSIRKRRTIIMIIAALAVMFATGVYAAVPKGVTHIDLITDSGETVKDSLEVYVGTETQLSCKTVPASFMNRDVEYSIADDKIAEIDKTGLLKALKDGETRLTVECAGVRKNYTVKVETAIEDITGLDEEITLYVGDEFQLEPKIKMADKELEKPLITYNVKRNTVATVDNAGLIKAVSEGETTITVTAGDVTKKVKVIVEATPEETYAPVVTVTDNNNNSDNRTNRRTSRKSENKSNGSSQSSGNNQSSGGDNTGGDNTGGDNTGGDNTGGDNTGGDNTGGDNTGGDNTGGDNTGGDNTGGVSLDGGSSELSTGE